MNLTEGILLSYLVFGVLGIFIALIAILGRITYSRPGSSSAAQK